MRFLATAFVVFMPLTAMAADSVSSQDLDDVYDYVDGALMGNSCKATGKNDSNCQVTCPPNYLALCSGDKTRVASCRCELGVTDRPELGTWTR